MNEYLFSLVQSGTTLQLADTCSPPCNNLSRSHDSYSIESESVAVVYVDH